MVQHGSIFIRSPSLRNPPKRYSVLKVLEQLYYRWVSMSNGSAWSVDFPTQAIEKGLASLPLSRRTEIFSIG